MLERLTHYQKQPAINSSLCFVYVFVTVFHEGLPLNFPVTKFACPSLSL